MTLLRFNSDGISDPQYLNSLKNCFTKVKNAGDKLISKSCLGAEWTGWFDYPNLRGREMLQTEVHTIRDRIQVDYDCLIVIGIGGSYLGARAVYDALVGEYGIPNIPIYFLGHHLSAHAIQQTLHSLENRRPLVNVISKSGTTIEPAISFRLVRHFLEKKFSPSECRSRIIATTDEKKGALREMVEREGWSSAIVPDDIGGRFSVLTAVGMLPLKLAGFEVESLLHGADIEFSEFKKNLENSSVARYSAHRLAAYEAGKTIEILSYAEPRMTRFVEWWKQLFGESEGKNGQGIFPAGMAYTTDLHSLGQFVQDGPRTLMENFLTIAPNPSDRLPVPKISGAAPGDGLDFIAGESVDMVNDAAFRASILAHRKGGVICTEIQTPPVSLEMLGQLFAFYETACGLSAAGFGVNPYDQPGVEAYKKEMMSLLQKRR